jgi:hypothetical protein
VQHIVEVLDASTSQPKKRDLSTKSYVYVWAPAVRREYQKLHSGVDRGDDAGCRKGLVGFSEGAPEKLRKSGVICCSI